jgi:hypothetical protein
LSASQFFSFFLGIFLRNESFMCDYFFMTNTDRIEWMKKFYRGKIDRGKASFLRQNSGA